MPASSLKVLNEVCLDACYLFVAEEAKAKYGADKIKIYNSTFTPMYYAVTSRKEKCMMKLICALPEEKVGHLIQIRFGVIKVKHAIDLYMKFLMSSNF